MYCPHCGHLNPDGALYCTNCGMRLSDTNPANPAASNPEATASFPRVVPSPEASSNTTPTYSTPAVEQPRRVVRSSRPHHRHSRQASAEQQAMPSAQPQGPTYPQEPAHTERTDPDAERTRFVPSEATKVVVPGTTSRVANDATMVARPAPSGQASAGQTPARTAVAASVEQPNRERPLTNDAIAGQAEAQQAYVAAPSPQAGSAYAASGTQRKHRNTPLLVACVAAVVVAVGLFVTMAAGVGPFAGGDASEAASETQEEPASASQQDTTDASASTSSSDAASASSNDTTSSSNAQTGTSNADSTVHSDTSSASSSDHDKDEDSSTSANSNSQSSDVVDNGSGTVSSKTYGYSISMPSQFTQQYGDETGATYYDAADDITIALWGDSNPSGTTMESAYQSAKSSAGNGDYVAHGKNWVVYSTDNANTGVVYDMTYYQNGKSCHMHISYPMSSKSVGDRIIEQVQPTFKLNS